MAIISYLSHIGLSVLYQAFIFHFIKKFTTVPKNKNSEIKEWEKEFSAISYLALVRNIFGYAFSSCLLFHLIIFGSDNFLSENTHVANIYLAYFTGYYIYDTFMSFIEKTVGADFYIHHVVFMIAFLFALWKEKFAFEILAYYLPLILGGAAAFFNLLVMFDNVIPARFTFLYKIIFIFFWVVNRIIIPHVYLNKIFKTEFPLFLKISMTIIG